MSDKRMGKAEGTERNSFFTLYYIKPVVLSVITLPDSYWEKITDLVHLSFTTLLYNRDIHLPYFVLYLL